MRWCADKFLRFFALTRVLWRASDAVASRSAATDGIYWLKANVQVSDSPNFPVVGQRSVFTEIGRISVVLNRAMVVSTGLKTDVLIFRNS